MKLKLSFNLIASPGFKPISNPFTESPCLGFAGYRDDYFRGADGFGVTLDGENISIGIDYEF